MVVTTQKDHERKATELKESKKADFLPASDNF